MNENLLLDIKAKLGINGGDFIDEEIRDIIHDIKEKDHKAFFKALSGEHQYLKPMQIVSKVAKEFKTPTLKDNLLENSRAEAKDMYDKFYAESSAMLDFTAQRRNDYPSDVLFFVSFNYAQAKKVDGSKAYTKKEIYVLRELGGGEWLMNIKLASNSQEVINKIHRIIADGIETKYSENEMLTNPIVSKMLKGNR